MRTLTLSEATMDILQELLSTEAEALSILEDYGSRFRLVLQAASELNAAVMVHDGELSEAGVLEMLASSLVH